MKEISTSVYQLTQALSSNGLNEFNSKLAVGKEFYSPATLDFEYIDPPLSIQYRSNVEGEIFENIDVVLISATGATGKSALSHYLSTTLHQPIYDMGEAGPVGDNSLIGMLSKNMAIAEMTSYLTDLSNGSSVMIIDAIDEGALKVTSQALNSFYNEIARLSSGTKHCIPSFVLTGRTHIMEIATLALEDKGLNVLLLQIEPFTIDKAKLFIDALIEKKKGMDKHNTAYINVRDLIINSVEGFFQNINDMKQRQYERFIGYAPVLQTIAALLNENGNYQQLYNELSSENKKNIALIIGIIEKIMWREKGKVNRELLPQITHNLSPKTIEHATKNAYSITEQCVRILCEVAEEQLNVAVSGDKAFDVPYEEKISEWSQEHPFYNKEKRTFVNVVFESYVIAYLLQFEEYRPVALKYLHSCKYKTSYMFFDFYHSFNQDALVDMQIIPYLYDSLISMDSKTNNVRMELTEEEQQLEVVFLRKEAEYIYHVKGNEDQLCLPMYCSDIVVDAPIRVRIPMSQKVDMKAPISLFCKEIAFESNELCLFENSNQQGGIVWETEKLVVNLPGGINPEIRDYLKNGTSFTINMQEKPSYPFIQYYSGIPNTDEEISAHNIYYQKLRRALLMFRSHSKGVLARYKDKIDNRIGISIQGKKVIAALMASGVMREDGIMYYLDNEKMANTLGVKYDDIQAAVINEQMKNFIRSIERYN